MTMSGKALINAFRQFITQIYKDAMLIIIILAPLLCGLFFKFGIPFAEDMLERYFGLKDLLTPYYMLFDLLLGSMTPLLYCFAAAYVILGEIDDKLSGYLAVTPLGKKGYLISRLGFPSALAFIVSFILMTVFSLTGGLSAAVKLGIAFTAALLGMIEALLVVAISGNRVEGMAISKLTGLLFLGLPLPFFVHGAVQYLMFFLPSFWSAKFMIEGNYLYLLLAVVTSVCFIMLLYKKFLRKLNK